MGSLTMNQIKSMPKFRVGWDQNWFCSGLLFWASFRLPFLGMKLTVRPCVKRLFLFGIFIKFFINTRCDFKLSTKREDSYVIIFLHSGEAEIPHNIQRWEGQRNGTLKLKGKSSLTLTQLLPWLIFVPLGFFPTLFPSITQSGHLSNCRSKGEQANKQKLKKITTENSYE